MDVSRELEGRGGAVERPDGSQIWTVRGGEGPVRVVFAHGYGVNVDEWNVVADALGEVGWLAFDLRGHGRSTIGRDGIEATTMAADYVAVLEHHEVHDAVLVGHSTGGFLAIRMLLDHPAVARERLRGCVLVATFAGDVNRRNPQNRIQIPLIQSGLLIRALGWSPIARAFVRSLCGPDFDEAYVEGMIRPFLRAQHRALVPLLHALGHESDYPRLGAIELPCVILVGTHDRTTPAFHAEDMHRGIVGSRLRRLEGKGHLLNWEAPEVVVEEIRRLLA